MQIGIAARNHRTVSQPLRARMNTGSPWIDAHKLLITTEVPYFTPADNVRPQRKEFGTSIL